MTQHCPRRRRRRPAPPRPAPRAAHPSCASPPPSLIHSLPFAGFKDLHNFAFLGANPRIGCASDFVFAYVPFGPLKQLEMYFHAVEACRQGREGVRSMHALSA